MEADTAMIVGLGTAGKVNEGVVGAKMARLHMLKDLGLPVPRAYTVTTAAFQYFILNNKLGGRLFSLQSEAVGTNLVNAARESREIICGSPMPGKLRESIVAAYEDLARRTGVSEPATAVRSSAVGEDSAAASFAGQYDSFLGISGAQEVCRHVQKVWASLFSDRAIEYRQRNRLGVDHTPMAVGIMQLVDTSAAGVAFSLDPVSGKKDRIVIESSWGLGEAVVQGEITPDRIAVDFEELRELSCVIGNKPRMLVRQASSNSVEWVDVSADRRTKRSIDQSTSIEIARIVKDLSVKVGHAVDVEWTNSLSSDRPGGALNIVQMRPISKAPAPPLLNPWRPSSSLR
jgi:pyruvate, water dikinase